MRPYDDWITVIAFGAFAVWFYLFMLWDFILATASTLQRMRRGEANGADMRVETQLRRCVCSKRMGLAIHVPVTPRSRSGNMGL
jgi:hypothetical protein